MLTIILFALGSCSTGTQQQQGNGPEFSVKTFKVNQGWAYTISVNHKDFIRQLYIPAIAGQKPFPSSEAAEKTARLVIDKINKKQRPSVTKQELLSLNIIKTTDTIN